MSRPASGTKSLVKDAWRRASTSKMLFADKMSEVGFSRPHGRQATEALTRVWLSVGVSKRSEEHTSELQSLMRISYAVFCLKKKNKKPEANRRKYRDQRRI